MFSTLKQRLMLGVYIFVLLTIPVGAYLASQNQIYKSSAKEEKPKPAIVKVTPKPTSSPAKQLLDSSQKAASPDLTATPSPSPASSEIATSFGPTLAFRVSIEGRQEGNQATRLFVGIMEGSLTVNPKFLLSFTVDVPASGEYGNLSLAGLNPGTRYSALLKGSNQIAASSAFTMSPAVSNLNDGNPLALTSGDLNEDNVINTADYSIAQKAFGATAKSANWNSNVDFNSDGIVNTFDLSVIIKNMGQTGASGAWTSPIPKVATPSASLNTPSIGGPLGDSGHWIWIPK